MFQTFPERKVKREGESDIFIKYIVILKGCALCHLTKMKKDAAFTLGKQFHLNS